MIYNESLHSWTFFNWSEVLFGETFRWVVNKHSPKIKCTKTPTSETFKIFKPPQFLFKLINSCNYRPSSVYFILFVLFFPFFLFLFAYLRFGSHFRSHDSHVTGEHMVELGAIFLLFFCKSKQFFNVQGHVHVHCILKVTFLVQVQEAVFRE